MNLLTLFLMSFAYLAITDNWTWQNSLIAFMLGLAITLLLRPSPHWRVNWSTLPTAIWATIQYMVMLMLDLIVSGFRVAWLVLQNGPIEQGIVKHRPALLSPLGLTLHAYSITLTPGELVVEIGEDGTIYTHTLNVDNTKKTIQVAQARRDQLLRKIIGETRNG